MRLEPELVHPSLAPFVPEPTSETGLDHTEMPRPQRLVAEAIVALLGSGRSAAEMEEYARRLNGILDAEALYRKADRTQEWTRLMEHLSEAKAYAVIVKTARSGMACGNALMGLDYALDEARDLIGARTAAPKAESPRNAEEPQRPVEKTRSPDGSESPTPWSADEPQRLVEEILASLDRSARTKAEKGHYARELNAALDASRNLVDSRPFIVALQRVQGAGRALETSLSSAAEKVALDYFELALEVMHTAARGRPLEASGYRFR